jgi:hypothetical protein
MARDCENCGSPSEVLVPVLRVYITPETWDSPGSSRTLSCVSLYPAEIIGDPTGE